MSVTRDTEIGEVQGPSCPCDVAGEWVVTCEAHPVNPDARGCPCPCHTRKYTGAWASPLRCTDCGRDHQIGAKHGPPQCAAVVTLRHRCEEKDGHDGGHAERCPALWRADVLKPEYVLRDGETFERDVLPPRVRAAYEKHIATIRSVARELGYAIGVHGSLRRDIDLIAAPWTSEASEPLALALAIEAAVGGYIDNGSRPDGPAYDLERKPPAHNAHGRVAWSIHLGGGPYIDLSVLPRIEPRTECEFTNELDHRIRITIEGPTSTAENVLTPTEAEQLRAALNAHHAAGEKQ